MALFRGEENVKSLDGREMPLMKVISETLKYIAEKAIEKLKDQLGEEIVKKEKIRWVLTVPALWSEKMKMFMRKAAVQAGIVKNWNSDKLWLCLEPEGASIQCREDIEEDELREKMTKGSIILVLDCGGGTVDITVSKLKCSPNEAFLSEEVLPSSGGCEWGSKYVDMNFEKFLKNFFDPPIFDYYTKNASSRFEILQHFELLKKKFIPDSTSGYRLQLSYLSECLNTKKLRELTEKYNKKVDKKYQVQVKGSSCIYLSQDLMLSFFKPLVEKIQAKVHELLEQTKKKEGYSAKFIFMVGGFSESPYLKSEIKKRFQNQETTVLIPKRPLISVIRGACMFGLNPRIITSRIAKKTYGINTLTVFDPNRHPEKKKVLIEGEEFCEDVFDVFVKKNQSVRVDELVNKIYCPVRARQSIMRIIIYCTDSTEVEFVDEPGVSKLGELSIDLGKSVQGDKTVTVTMRFGATSIMVTVTNKRGEARNCEFKFDSK